MKLYQDYKRLYKSVFIFFLGILVFIPLVFSYAQTARELNEKIDEKNIEIEKLEREIKLYQGEIEDLSKQKNSLNVSLRQLDLTRKKLIADMSITQSKIDKTNFKIKELGLEINNKEDIILNNMEAISLDIRKINEFEQNDILATILSEDSFTMLWNDVDNMATLSEKIIESTNELKLVKSDLEDTRKETTDAKNELIALKSKLNDQKKIVDQNTVEKKKLLTQTKNNEVSYQKLLADRLAKKIAFEKELDEYESQLKYILDPSKLPGKNSLNFPLDSIYITDFFGYTGSRYHKGVDFRASIGTPVRAMSDGKIAGIGDTDLQCYGVSYGKFILVKFNNGLAATYGHLSLIKVREGTEVKRGQVIGYSGNSGSSTGPHLHISIYPKDAVNLQSRPSISCPNRVLTQPVAALNAYLNPLNYLPSYK